MDGSDKHALFPGDEYYFDDSDDYYECDPVSYTAYARSICISRVVLYSDGGSMDGYYFDVAIYV